LFSFRWLKNKDFSQISPEELKKVTGWSGIVLLAVFLVFFFEIYIPVNPSSHETLTYTVEKGWGDDEIAKDLQKLGVIKSNLFFRLYVVTSLKHSSLQAGKYNLSPRMSSYQIAQKMANGDVIKNKLVILEGWDLNDVSSYLESKGICAKNEFVSLAQKDYSKDFDFLKDKPGNVSLEGYIFPDTYEVAEGESCEDVLSLMLSNFGQRLTADLRKEAAEQKKSIFDIVTMASLIEKEVRNMDDKKVVSGILWKRIDEGMPLQLDCTVNYATGKSDPAVLIKDTKIDSPYNTYKYYGLPKGPIANPGLGSILSALYPTVTKYWYYLSDGKTYFSETFEQHTALKAKYLR